MKSLKQEHACFHPDLAVFNRFKSLFRQLKEFYFYYEASLSTLDKVYAWNYELIVKQQQNGSANNEYFDLVNKIGHLADLIRQLRSLVNEKCLFEYTAETTTNTSNNPVSVESEDSYQYDYDNNPTMGEQVSSDMADYCTIDEEDEENEETPNRTEEDVNSATLKRSTNNQEVVTSTTEIRREVQLEEEDTEHGVEKVPIRLTGCDQMLIKFYLKHIEENLTELSVLHRGLVEKLDSTATTAAAVRTSDERSKATAIEIAHKLAINGHKLVFICDTLQRNLNNLSLKQSLFESSNSLCSALKVYMIRLKSSSSSASSSSASPLNESFRNLILESTGQVFECANHFKSLILKYYFKSF